MKICVTDDDISRGKVRDDGLCPVARALKRTFKTEMVSVCQSEIAVKRMEWVAPKEVDNFVQRFDAGLPVEPFEFELETVEECEPAEA